MGISKEGAQPRRLIGGEAKLCFLAALRAGETRDAAAAASGFALKSLYGARRRDPLFRLAWLWAMDLSAGIHHLDRPDPEDGTLRIAPQRGRKLQKRRMGWVRFTEERQRIFLDHFAGTADATAAAAAAGVSGHTVKAHRRNHPEFAALWDEALAEAYATLEAEAVRQRLDAQRRLRESLCPTGEVAQEFERVLKLLQRWDRRDGRIGSRAVRPGHQRRWTFDEAIEALDKRLRALGARRLLPSPAGGSEE